MLETFRYDPELKHWNFSLMYSCAIYQHFVQIKRVKTKIEKLLISFSYCPANNFFDVKDMDLIEV